MMARGKSFWKYFVTFLLLPGFYIFKFHNMVMINELLKTTIIEKEVNSIHKIRNT